MDELRFRRVHVAGAGGLLGAAVARELAADGHELLHATAPVDAVVHCPAPVPPGRLTHRRLAAHRRLEAARASALARDALVSNARLVHVGSAFAWGDHGSSWIDEGTPQHPAPLGAGDADVARSLLALREERGLDVVLVALGLVYGPGGVFERALLDRRARVVGWGGNYLSCVHVDDGARAVAAALERGAAGTTYLAVDDEPVTQRALADAVADAAGRPRPGTASLSMAAARVGFPLARSLAASQRVRNARAKAELGWAPRFPTVREGVWTARRR
jgi:nucleoside-diphosphate-sugar epimerase